VSAAFTYSRTSCVKQTRIAQKLERFRLLAVRELAPLRRFCALLLPFLQILLELQQHLAQIALYHALLHPEFIARELGEMSALPRRVQLQRVHVEGASLALAEDVHAERPGQRFAR
jgi:hypothetical protein